MSRMSKNADLTKTRLRDHKSTSAVLRGILFDTDKEGNTEVTIPHAIAIRTVFEPGISLILLYLRRAKRFGTSVKL